jgi:hypothetical protein
VGCLLIIALFDRVLRGIGVIRQVFCIYSVLVRIITNVLGRVFVFIRY